MRSSLNWVVSFKKYISPLSKMLFPMSETFKKSQMSELFDVSAGCLRLCCRVLNFAPNVLQLDECIFYINP